MTEDEESKLNQKMTCPLFKVVLSKIYRYSLQLGLMIYLHYALISFLGKRSTKNMSGSFPKDIAFEFIMIFSWIGNVIGKASLEYVKVQKVYYVLFLEVFIYMSFVCFGTFLSVPILLLIILNMGSGLFIGIAYSNLIY